MTELDFECAGADVDHYAAAPTLNLRLRITEKTGQAIHSIMLQCRLRIQPRQRSYSEAETGRLRDLYGEPDRWGQTLQPLQLAQVSLTVPPFRGDTEMNVPVPFTYDFEVASAKYLHGLRDGEIPLELLFSGTVFRKAPQGFAVDQVPWDREARYRLPVRVWREMMDHYFPTEGWIRMRRESIDALQAFKSRGALPTWDEAVRQLLDKAGETRDDF